jgi:glycosyltransferase involved in cell wall biosynthesis
MITRMSEPLVSVIVPTRNRVGYLPGLLQGLEAQHFPPERWELIVVDDGSTDDTAAYLQDRRPDHPDLRFQLIRQPDSGGSAAARNLGAANASGRILLFLDDDMLPSSSLLAEHVRCQDQGADVVIGRFGAPDAKRAPWIAWEDYQIARHFSRLDESSRVPGGRDFYSGNVSVAAYIFVALGGFDPSLWRMHDVAFGHRLEAAGARFAYCPAAFAVHRGEHSFAGWLTNARLSGQTEHRLARSQAEIRGRIQVYRWPTRNIIRVCARIPFVEPALIAAMARIGLVSHRLGARKASLAAYSAIYNLAFWMSALGRRDS